MLKVVDEIDFLDLASHAQKELITKSFNSETTLNSETKLIIVGTLTPPNTKYFYCSFMNKIYGYIDEAFRQLGNSEDAVLKSLKIGLSRHKNVDLLSENEASERVKEIKSVLLKNGIAFLDVMNNVIRRKNTYLDDDIEYFTLAINDFSKINQSAVIITNSKLADSCVKLMKIKVKTRYISQRLGKKEEWVEAIKESLS